MDEPIPYLPEKEQGEFFTTDGDPEFVEPFMFGKGMYLSVFYCLCCAKDRSTDMSEGQVAEERVPDLNEEEDTRMEDSREEHCRDIDEDGEAKSNIHALMWYVYTREKEELIKRDFLVSVTHTKGGNIVWTCVKGNIIEENDVCVH